MDFPICLLDYFEKGKEEKAIEIRFDREGITMTCTFDGSDMCDSVLLFPDTDEIMEGFVDFLQETHSFDFIKTQWMASHYNMEIKEVTRSVNDICFRFNFF